MDKGKVNELGHLLAGLILLFHGFDSFEIRDYRSASLYLFLGLLFMVIAGLQKSISKKFIQGNAAFFLVESFTILYSGWHYKSKGHPYLFYLFTAAGIMFFVFSCRSFILEDKPRKRKSRKRRRRSSLYSHLDIPTAAQDRPVFRGYVKESPQDNKGDADTPGKPQPKDDR